MQFYVQHLTCHFILLLIFVGLHFISNHDVLYWFFIFTIFFSFVYPGHVLKTFKTRIFFLYLLFKIFLPFFEKEISSLAFEFRSIYQSFLWPIETERGKRKLRVRSHITKWPTCVLFKFLLNSLMHRKNINANTSIHAYFVKNFLSFLYFALFNEV